MDRPRAPRGVGGVVLARARRRREVRARRPARDGRGVDDDARTTSATRRDVR